MLNRRLIRVKVLQAVYAYHQSEIKDLKSAKSFLKKSILGIEDTFVSIFQFPFDLFHYVITNRNPADKHLKMDEASTSIFNILSSNMCLDVLADNPKSALLLKSPSAKLSDDNDFYHMIYKQATESEWLQELSTGYTKNFINDQTFMVNFYKYLIETSIDFNIKMEEINIHWQDEKIPVLKSIEKLINSCSKDGGNISIPIISKDIDDDLAYAEKLLELTAKNHEIYEQQIANRTPDWDVERIARLDLYIMIMALSEFLEFSNIPVKVTLNEYLELAKIYSTPQSSKFINGILDKLLEELKKDGQIKKQGRGLVE